MRKALGGVAIVFVLHACGARSSLDGYGPADATSSTDVVTPDASVIPDVGIPDVLEAGVVSTPRPIAPLSTSSVTTQRPTFHWLLTSEASGARLEICTSRDCSSIEQTVDAIGDHVTLSSPLAAGVHFYRLHGIAGSVVGGTTSATFEFVVPHRSTPRDTSWGTFPDFDGDGFADVVIGGVSSAGANTFTVFPGSPSGVHHKIRVDVSIPSTEETVSLASAGDIDGDGFGDLVLSTQTDFPKDEGYVFVYRGGPSGIATKPAFTILAASTGAQHVFGVVTSAGDLNGDGYADVVVADRAIADGASDRFLVFFGSAQGLSSTPSITLDGDPGAAFAVGSGEGGDVDGDGYADVVAFEGGGSEAHLYFFRGSATGPSTASRTLVATLSDDCADVPVSPTPGDVNGDGFADIAVVGMGTCGSVGSKADVFYGGISISPPTTLSAPTGYTIAGAIQFAGDVNGDGYDDLVAGLIAPVNTPTAGLLFAGSSTGVSNGSSSLVEYSPVPPNSLGWVVGAGDLDRDGFGDLLLLTTGTFLTALRGGTNNLTFATEVGPLDGGSFIGAFR